MRQPRTSDLFPGISVIDLDQPSGIFRRSLIRHWTNHNDGRPCLPWYELVLRTEDRTVTYVLPCERLTAAQLLVTDGGCAA